MDQAYPLARLATVVALARSRPAPTRLLLRNTDRFGVLHLYFAGGRLLAVEGHRDTPENSLADLATWDHGTIRTDEGEVALLGDADPRLEVALAHALAGLAARGALESPLLPQTNPRHPRVGAPDAPPFAPSPRPASHPAPFATPRTHSGVSRTPSAPFAASYPTVQTAVQPSPTGLPPLSAAPEVPLGPPRSLPPREGPPASSAPQSFVPAQDVPTEPLAADVSTSDARLSAEQWQLLSFAIHQIVAQARVSIGETLTMQMFRQALAHSARAHACLAPLALELSGWLTVTPPDAMTTFHVGEVVEAVADVLSGFEMRCASLIGPDRAKQIIVTAAAPLRAGLLEIGLDVAG